MSVPISAAISVLSVRCLSDLCEGWMRRLGQDVIAVDFAHAGRALPLRLFPCLQAQVDELCVGYDAETAAGHDDLRRWMVPTSEVLLHHHQLQSKVYFVGFELRSLIELRTQLFSFERSLSVTMFSFERSRSAPHGPCYLAPSLVSGWVGSLTE